MVKFINAECVNDCQHRRISGYLMCAVNTLIVYEVIIPQFAIMIYKKMLSIITGAAQYYTLNLYSITNISHGVPLISPSLLRMMGFINSSV